jgi:predicted MFS family arabinose efflux permease
VYGLAVLLGVCLGLFESIMPARVAELGLAAASAGPLLSLVAAGSGLGGLLASARIQRADPGRLAVALLAALGALMVPSAMTGSPWLLGCALFLLGLPIAPLNALGTLQLQRTVPGGRQAEGFALLLAAVLVGAGLGNTLTSRLLDALGPSALIAAAAALRPPGRWCSQRWCPPRPGADVGPGASRSRVPPGRVLASGRHRRRSDRR